MVEDLKSRLALKDQLFQELLSDRSLQSHQHQAQLQDLLNTVGSKDQYLQVAPMGPEDYYYCLHIYIDIYFSRHCKGIPLPLL